MWRHLVQTSLKQDSVKNSMASIHTHIPSAHSLTSATARRGKVSDSDPLSEMNFCFVLRNEKRILHNSALCFIHLLADFKALMCVFDREYINLWVALDESDHHSCESNTKRQIEGVWAGKEEVCFSIRDSMRECIYVIDAGPSWFGVGATMLFTSKKCLSDLSFWQDHWFQRSGGWGTRALETLGMALLPDETVGPYEARLR